MITVNNLSGVTIDKKSLEKIAKIVLKGENVKMKDVSVVLVGVPEIKKLNKKYRKKNKPTDVLSFDYKDVGEIVLCLAEIKKNASKFGNVFKKEIVKVLVHGLLHLCGYEHEKSQAEAVKMAQRENRYIKFFK